MSLWRLLGWGGLVFFFGFWVVLSFIIRSAVHRGLDGDGLPKNPQLLSLSLFLLESQQHWGQTRGEGAETAPPSPLPISIPRGFGRCDNFSAHFPSAFLRNSLVQTRSNGNRPRFAESIDPLCCPGPISQNSSLSLNLPLGNARWKRQGCAQDISTNLLLEEKNHFEPCGVSPSRKNDVQEGKETWKCSDFA